MCGGLRSAGRGGGAAVALAVVLASASPARAQDQAYVVEGAMLAVIDGTTHTVIDRVPLLDAATDVAVSPDGATAYVTHPGQLAIVDLHARVIRAAPPIRGEGLPAWRVRLSPAGDRAALYNLEPNDIETRPPLSILVFDTVAQQLLQSIWIPIPWEWPTVYPLDLALSDDRRRAHFLVSIAEQGLWLYEIDTESGTVGGPTPLQTGRPYYGGAVVAFERGVAYARFSDAILGFDLSTGQVIERVPVDVGGWTWLLWDPGRQRLFAWSYSGGETDEISVLAAIDVESGRARRLARFDWWPRDLALAPGGGALYATASDPVPRTVVVDTDTGAVTALVSAEQEPNAVAVAPRPTGAPVPIVTARPLPTPAPLEAHRAFAASDAARTLAEIDTAAPAVTRTTGDPALERVRDLVASPDGRWLYGVNYQSLIVLDPESGAVAGRVEVPDAWNGLEDVTLGPDGTTVWVAGSHSVWEIDTVAGTVLGRVEIERGAAALSFAPGGRRLYVPGGPDYGEGYLQVVDPIARRTLRSITLPAEGMDVAVSLDGRRAYVATRHSVTVVDTAAERVEAVVPVPGGAGAIALSPDGAFAYVTGAEPWNATRPVLSVIDTASLRQVAALPLADSGTGRRIVLTPDGQRALIAIDATVGRVMVVDLSRLAIVSALRVGAGPRGLAVAPGAWTPPALTPLPHRTPGPLQPCMLVSHWGGTVTLIDPTRHAVAGSILIGKPSPDEYTGEEVYDSVRGVAADPDGTLLYAAVQPRKGGAGYLAAVDTASRAVVDTLYVGNEPWFVTVTADGARAFVWSQGPPWPGGPTMAVVDLRAWRVVDEVFLDAWAGPYSSPDGRTLYVRRHTHDAAGELVDVLTAIDASTLTTVFEIPLPSKEDGWGMAVIPDGRTLFVDLGGGRLEDAVGVVDLEERALVGTIEVPITSWGGRPWGPASFAVSPDGSQVYRTTAANPGTVVVVDVAARRVVDQIPVELSLSLPEFTPDDAFVYARSWPWRADVIDDIAVIDAATRRVVRQFAIGEGAIDLVAAMIDGACDAPPAPPETPTVVATPVGPPATPTPTAPGPTTWLELAVGSAAGEPGTTVAVDVRLASGESEVSGVQIEVAFRPPLRIVARADGRPACRVNPEINKESASVFWPIGCSADGCWTARTVVLAFDNTDPIPDGAVAFTCDVAIAADAEEGTYPLRVIALGASDAHGNALPVLGRDGTVTVRPPVKQSLHATSDDGGGCAIAPPAAAPEVWWLVVLAGLLAIVRWRDAVPTRLR